MWWIVAGVAVVVLIAALFFIIRFLRKRNASMISVVMLRTKPLPLTESDVRGAFRRAFKAEAKVEATPMPDGNANAFMVLSDSIPPLGVICAKIPYMPPDEARDIAEHLEHEVTRNAMTQHTCWVSVDAMGVDSSSGKDIVAGAHALCAKLAAEFADEDCLLLFLPATNRVAEVTSKAIDQLRAGELDTLFGDDDLHQPIFRPAANDADVAAAMAEAQRRLPEFLNAVSTGAGDQPALFKARFDVTQEGGEQGNEYIWLSLKSVSGTGLTGTIENPPLDKSIPPKGSTVTIELGRVVDWLYVDSNKKPQGMFVDRVLLKKQK